VTKNGCLDKWFSVESILWIRKNYSLWIQVEKILYRGGLVREISGGVVTELVGRSRFIYQLLCRGGDRPKEMGTREHTGLNLEKTRKCLQFFSGRREGWGHFRQYRSGKDTEEGSHCFWGMNFAEGMSGGKWEDIKSTH